MTTTMTATKLYEGMFLFDSNLAAKDWPGLERLVQEILHKSSAELVYSERWPDRKLAYDIKGCKKGTYYLTYFKAPPHALKTIERDSLLSEKVLRVLILYDEGLVKDCEKRLRQEVTGSPEEIEEQRERLRREAEGISGTGTTEDAPAYGTRRSPALLAVEEAEEAAPDAAVEPE
ncbi:MAG: 30S ribosomal protein S6 [Planctomycetes bacterium]|nr:30S ribosomal protein S6 [Planctomycetota bacterium]